MIGQVLKTIFRYNMLPDGARAGVAVSGGADSVALLHVLHRLSVPRRWSLRVLHFDHLLRGPESDADRQFVEELSASLGLECCVGSADVRDVARGANLEQTARQLRYQFFADIRVQQKLDAVATGHTASDQAETVLMRLFQGASPDSLSGIRAVNLGWVMRPFLDLTRDQVRDWLRSEGLKWREDSSNQDNCYDRNRLRNEVLPLLRNQWNPKLEAALSRLAELAARDEEFWIAQVEANWPQVAASHRLGIVLDVEKLRLEHPALQTRVLKRACAEAAGGRFGSIWPRMSHGHVEELLGLVAQEEGDGRVSLPGLEAWRSFSQILLHKRVIALIRVEAMALTAPGVASLSVDGPQLRAGKTETCDGAYNEGSSWLDGSLAPGPFLLRPWRAGDRYGASGRLEECSVHELLQRRKIPAWDRAEWPVLEFQGQIVWARGLGVAMGWRAGSRSECSIQIAEESVDARQ